MPDNMAEPGQPSLSDLDWDDLRCFGAIASEGSVAGAARKLKRSHSSVLRRLNQLEDTLGVTLVHRHRGGCTLTRDGEEVAEATARMEGAAGSLSHRVGTGEAMGTLRIAAVGGAGTILLPLLRSLNTQHPKLKFELIVGDGLVDLKRGEADLALRLTVSPPPPDLIGVCHGTVAFAAYRHEQDTASTEDRGTKAGKWVVLGDSLQAVPQAMFERAHVAETQRWLAVNSGGMVYEALIQNAARGVLTCLQGDAHPQLVRIGEPIPELALELWTLYPRSLKRAPALQVFREALGKRLNALGPHLRGEVHSGTDAK